MSKETQAALLEVLRIVVIAILPVILMGIDQENGTININWNVVVAVALIALIKGLDKWVHTVGKQANDNNLKRGLTRF